MLCTTAQEFVLYSSNHGNSHIQLCLKPWRTFRRSKHFSLEQYFFLQLPIFSFLGIFLIFLDYLILLLPWLTRLFLTKYGYSTSLIHFQTNDVWIDIVQVTYLKKILRMKISVSDSNQDFLFYGGQDRVISTLHPPTSPTTRPLPNWR